MNMWKATILLTVVLTCLISLSLAKNLFQEKTTSINNLEAVAVNEMTNPTQDTNIQTDATASSVNEAREDIPVYEPNQEALKVYDSALKLYYQRKFYEALPLFDKALSIDPNCYQALNGKGATLAFLGKYKEGIDLIKKAQAINPTFVYARFNEGLAYELAGQWNESISAYHEALKLDKNDTWSWYGIASVYGRQGNIEKVLEYLRPAIELETDVKAVAREEKDFAPVRNDSRFQELVKP